MVQASETIIPCPGLSPPRIHGVAALAHRAYVDHGLDDLLAFIDRRPDNAADHAALTLDAATAHALRFRKRQAAALQSDALAASRLFRVGFAPDAPGDVRVLALLAPGDLMVNAPLDFITAHLRVRLDLLFLAADDDPPARVPDHDLAFVAVSEQDPATLRRLGGLLRGWPRPVLNDPRAILALSRDGVASGLAGLPGVCSPRAVRVTRAALGDPRPAYPVLIRPAGSHAGQDLGLLACDDALPRYLARTPADEFFVTQFVDYRSADGMFRKWRIAFIGGEPFVCHMAVSDHWMVHYLNAGMSDHADRRAEEARAMAGFDQDFGRRHRAALASVAAWAGLDYFQIDCGELPDGRLVVFEADVAAIVHLMDDPDLFAYKRTQMQRVFAAFEAMLRRRVSARPGPSPGA